MARPENREYACIIQSIYRLSDTTVRYSTNSEFSSYMTRIVLSVISDATRYVATTNDEESSYVRESIVTIAPLLDINSLSVDKVTEVIGLLISLSEQVGGKNE